jgi:hypothetical protein
MLCFRRAYWQLRCCHVPLKCVQALSSVLGLAQEIKLFAVLLLCCMDLLTSDILMH